MSFGDRADFYFYRSKPYAYDFDDYDRALDDISRAIRLRQTKHKSYLRRAKYHFAKRDYEKALATVEGVEKMWPRLAAAHKWRKRASRKLNKRGQNLFAVMPEEALRLLDLSISFRHDSAKAYRLRGMTHLQLKKAEAAVADFKKSVELAPHNFDNLNTAIMFMRTNRAEKTALDLLNAFLELEPDHAKGYEMRATFFIEGDKQRSWDDYRKACTLGSEKACQTIEKLENPQPNERCREPSRIRTGLRPPTFNHLI